MKNETKAEYQTRIKKLSAALAKRKVKRVLDYSYAADERPKPLVRRERNGKPRLRKMIAYDLETTRIEKGTPRPLYITAKGADFWVSARVKNMLDLGRILRDTFLTEENKNARFIAWNGNRFDVFFIASALLHDSQYVLRPYMTRTKNLRGLRVTLRNDEKTSWEFLDGMAMLGMQKKLKDFLKVFAPEFHKIEDAINFETETFDYRNRKHVEYAERDSEGLYHAMVKAEKIVLENFNLGLAPTVGNMAIKILITKIPEGVTCWPPCSDVLGIVRDYVMRGGYCFCQRKYEGPVWKYDINQAYASAMRDAKLPAGRCGQVGGYVKGFPAIYRVSGTYAKNIIPFMHRSLATRRSVFALRSIDDTWITSIEYDQLKREGWHLEIHDGWKWSESFNLRHYVKALENLRVNAPGGPKGAQGEMMKSIGNNSYGKTVERLEGLELVMSAECPEGYRHYQTAEEELQHIWFKLGPPAIKDYHQPQIGAFITAHVRMVVRRAILKKPQSWLYADTDCTVFTEPVDLPFSNTEYGKWKIEAEGEHFRIIDKKVYAKVDATEKHAKGMNVGRLTSIDFENWYNGTPPVQIQIHKNNFVKSMTGSEMYIERTRRGSLKNISA